jgi:hypothetical protein
MAATARDVVKVEAGVRALDLAAPLAPVPVTPSLVGSSGASP